ncbi:MAG: hypothetical protein US70_C0001G0038 [Parcubacteria group bacterium GW2011_GWD2_38_11]|nr:MAG: hypothetical protein US70_C0001G0038 [Parcubacteria group bacterium GW2011_GWD2_38_11]
MITEKSLLTVSISLQLLDFLILKELVSGGCPKEQLSFCFENVATEASMDNTVSFKVTFPVDLSGTKTYIDNQKRLSQILTNVSEISNEIREILKQKVLAVL